MKVWCAIGGTAGDRGTVSVMNVGDIVDGGCNGKVLHTMFH